jgi:Flp pilus assembly protein TadD
VALTLSGWSASHRGDEVEAQARFGRAVASASEPWACAHAGLGLLALRQDRSEQAVDELQRAVTLEPQHGFRAHNALASIHIDRGRYDEAELLLRRSIAIYPHDSEARVLLEELDDKRGRSIPPAKPE